MGVENKELPIHSVGNKELGVFSCFVILSALLKLSLDTLYYYYDLISLGYSHDFAMGASIAQIIFTLLLSAVLLAVLVSISKNIEIKVRKDVKVALYLIAYFVSMFVMFLIMYDVINLHNYILSLGYPQTHALETLIGYSAIAIPSLLFFAFYYIIKAFVEAEIKKLEISGGGVHE